MIDVAGCACSVCGTFQLGQSASIVPFWLQEGEEFFLPKHWCAPAFQAHFKRCTCLQAVNGAATVACSEPAPAAAQVRNLLSRNQRALHLCQLLHNLRSLSDPSGDSAIVEWIDGKLRIWHGKEWTVS